MHIRKIYKPLSQDRLYELLYASVKSMLFALDPKDGSPASYKTIKRHVAVLCELIEEKANEKKKLNYCHKTILQVI